MPRRPSPAQLRALRAVSAGPLTAFEPVHICATCWQVVDATLAGVGEVTDGE